jgi:nucleoid DNA-binding protein
MSITYGLNEMARQLYKHRKKNSPLTREDCCCIPKILCDGIIKALLEGNKIRLERIGTLEIKSVKGRCRRNPNTGEVFYQAEKKGVKFHGSKHFCKILNQVKDKSKKRLRVVPFLKPNL